MENTKNSEILAEFKTLYLKQEYDQAISLLKTNEEKFDKGLLEYNLGLLNLKKGNFVEARVLLEKAKLHGFYSNELNNALSEVKKNLDVSTLEASSTLSDDFNQVSLQVPFDAYLFVCLFFIVLVLGFYKKIDKYIRIILFVFAMLPIVFYFQHVKQHEKIIVLEDQYVYRGPSKMFEQTQLIPKGMKLLTGKNHNGWRYIVTPESHKGWFYSNDVENL